MDNAAGEYDVYGICKIMISVDKAMAMKSRYSWECRRLLIIGKDVCKWNGRHACIM